MAAPDDTEREAYDAVAAQLLDAVDDTLADHAQHQDDLRRRIATAIDRTLGAATETLRNAQGGLAAALDSYLGESEGLHESVLTTIGMGIDYNLAGHRNHLERVAPEAGTELAEAFSGEALPLGNGGRGGGSGGTPPEEPIEWCVTYWPHPTTANTYCYRIDICNTIPPSWYERATVVGPFAEYGLAQDFVRSLPGFQVWCNEPPGEPPPPPPGQPPPIRPPIGEQPPEPPIPPPIPPPPPPPIFPPPVGEEPPRPPVPPPPPPCPTVDPCYPTPTILVGGGSHRVRPLTPPFWMGIHCTSDCEAEWACWQGWCPPLPGSGWRIFGPHTHCPDPDPFVRLCLTGSWPPGVERPPIAGDVERPPGVEDPPPPPQEPPPQIPPEECMPQVRHQPRWEGVIPHCLDEARYLGPIYGVITGHDDVEETARMVMALVNDRLVEDPPMAMEEP